MSSLVISKFTWMPGSAQTRGSHPICILMRWLNHLIWLHLMWSFYFTLLLMKEYNLSCLADYMLVRSSSSSFPDDILHSGQQTSSLLAPPFPFWLIWWFAITLLSQPIFIHSLSKLLRHLGPWPPQLQLQRFGLSAGSQAFQFIVTTLLGLPHILAIWSDSSADGEQFTALRFLPLSIEQPYSWTWCLL